jgi:hypothetical protein
MSAFEDELSNILTPLCSMISVGQTYGFRLAAKMIASRIEE